MYWSESWYYNESCVLMTWFLRCHFAACWFDVQISSEVGSGMFLIWLDQSVALDCISFLGINALSDEWVSVWYCLDHLIIRSWSSFVLKFHIFYMIRDENILPGVHVCFFSFLSTSFHRSNTECFYEHFNLATCMIWTFSKDRNWKELWMAFIVLILVCY